MPRFLIVEDQEIFRQGVRLVLGTAFPEATFGEAGDVPQAMARLASGSWDLLLLDAGLPGRSGLELLQDAHRDWPGMPVLVLSTHQEEELALRAIRLGAAGFLAKSSASAELVTAVRKILDGGRYITASLSEQLARFVSGERTEVPHDELSPREAATPADRLASVALPPTGPPHARVTLMSRHLRSTEIARLLGVSVATVKRWTDSGLLLAERTAGGHRRFSPAVVERAASQLAGKDAQVEQWLQLLVGAEGRLAIDAALLGERSRAEGWEAVAESLGRVLVELGDRWRTGRLSVVDEHIASARLARALARVCDPLAVRLGAPRAVLATVEGEAHSLGLALVELCMRERGWQTIWMGPDTPTEALVRHLEASSVEVLALSASVERDAAGLCQVSIRLGELCARAGVALIAGGMGPWPDPLPFGELIREFGDLGDWIDSFERRRPRSRGPGARRRQPGNGHVE